MCFLDEYINKRVNKMSKRRIVWFPERKFSKILQSIRTMLAKNVHILLMHFIEANCLWLSSWYASDKEVQSYKSNPLAVTASVLHILFWQ